MVEVSEIWTLVSCIFQALWPGSRCLWPARPTSRSASASACAQRSWKDGKGGGQVYNCVKWVADVVLILLLAFFRDFFWKFFCHEVFAKLRVLDGSGFRMANSDRGPSICQEAGPNARRDVAGFRLDRNSRNDVVRRVLDRLTRRLTII
jgi:hypothetical protein